MFEDLNALIIAPHPDDELIGCFRLLKSGRVMCVYFIDVDTDEYLISSKTFCFKVLTNLSDVPPSINCVLVPDPLERHPLHKEAYVLGRKLVYKLNFEGCTTFLGFYSTQMDASYVDVLSKELAEEKREALNIVYSSKSDMWKYEHKYWLYEGVVIRL